MQDRVVITGIGTVNPIGNSLEETWENALNGISGVGPITLFDPVDLEVKFACEVKNFDPTAYMSARDVRRRDRFELFSTAAAAQAIRQAGLENGVYDKERVSVIMASAVGGIETIQNGVLAMHEDGPRRISPLTIPRFMINGAAGFISIDYGFQGPSYCVVSACASGIDGIGMGWMMLRSGVADAVIAGGTEATITKIGVATFDRAGAMSRRNDDYSSTPQPFDLNRDGLVMGEGAAVFVLELESKARKRGAPILAELAGYAASADAHHVTAPCEDGSGAALAVRWALQAAGLNAEDMDYINAHGTATKLNDVTETRAIKSVFGERAYDIPISSTKSMTGHVIGASGAVETALCIQAVRENVIPPTINYQTPDPECDLDYVPNQAREVKVSVAMNNAFGFGGHNAVLIVREYK
jgi:beta-ketoacyl-acyl-carrier-protein synthase II